MASEHYRLEQMDTMLHQGTEGFGESENINPLEDRADHMECLVLALWDYKKAATGLQPELAPREAIRLLLKPK